MDILIVCSSLEVGGAERHVAVLAPALRARGFGVAVTVLKHEGRFADELRAAGIPVHLAAMGSRRDLPAIWRAYRAISPRPDVIVSQSVDAQVLGHFLARRSGVAHVTIEHGGLGVGLAPHRRALVRLVARRVDAAVAVSDSQVPGLVAAGYQQERIRVIANGIPTPTPSRSTGEVRAELDVGPNDVVALLVAALRPEKRVSSFIDSVTAASAHDPRIRGVVAGGGSDLERLRGRAAAAGGSVTLLGQRADVGDLVAASDLVCLTSRTEGLPVSVLEAMALGRPVLATAVGGLPAAVVDGVTGVLVPPADDAAFTRALLDLAAAPTSRERMGRAGRERFANRYTVEQMADAYDLLLSQLGRARS